jgi:ABC-type transport system substrate-binding protein
VLVGALALLLTACTPPGLPDPIVPSAATSVPTKPPAAGTVVIGLDGSAGPIAGFNPYSIADFSLASQAAASLVLPSVFVIAADGTPAPDIDVIDKAEVTSQDPFTVTYTLDRKASWSDGTPITAEDFSYLRDQLDVQPGTVNSAGYQLISQIRSRDAGKLVEVEFSEPLPDWQTLFSPLLPSHLMKDFPGGWGAALGADLPLSANRFKMNSYDPVTGQISLARNDKYWGTPPQPAAVVLRLGDPVDLLAANSRGDVQALWFAPTGAMAASLQDAVPADLRTIVPIPASTQLIFNTTSGPTQVQSIRTAIAAGITQSAVAADLTGGWPEGGTTVTSQVRLPSEARDIVGGDGRESAQSPVVTGEQAANSGLAAAGYLRNGLYVSRNGEVLRLVLGYPSGDPRLVAAARTIQRQLGSIGIEIDLLPDAAPNLVETRIATGAIDLALLAVPRGIADAVSAASAFGCPSGSVLGIGSTVTAEPTPTDTAQPDAPVTSATATTADPADDSTPGVRTGNLSGYCEPSTQRILFDALVGQGAVGAADPSLWADLPVLPLMQPSAVFAVAEPLRTVLDGSHEGWMWSGPLSGLSGWPVG